MSYLPRHLFRPVVANPRTVGELIDFYLAGGPGWHGAAAEYPSNSTTSEASNMAYALTDFRNTAWDHDGTTRVVNELKPDEMRTADLRACMDQLVATGITRNGVNARKARVLRWVRWLVKYEHADAATLTRLETVGPIKATHPGVTNKPRVACVPEADVAATCRVACGTLRRAIRVHQLTGLRPGELVQMRVCDITPHDDETWAYTPAHHKTEHAVSFARVIAMGPLAQAEIRDQVSAMADAAGALFAMPRLGDQSDQRRLWPWTTTNGYYQAVRRAADRAGVTRWSPNQLRHNLLTRAVLDADAKTAGSLGGHADDKTALRNYFHGHASPAMKWAKEHG